MHGSQLGYRLIQRIEPNGKITIYEDKIGAKALCYSTAVIEAELVK